MKVLHVGAQETNSGWGADYFLNLALHANGHDVIGVDFRKHRRDIRRWIRQARGFEVFLLQRGDFFPRSVIRSIPGPRVFWASELFLRNRDQDRLFRSGLFDHIYVRTEQCRAAIVERGWQPADRVSILLSAFAPWRHRRLHVPKSIDLAFIGNITPRRQRALDRLRAKLGDRLWAGKAFGEDYVRVVNAAKIVLNIHADDVADTETRVYEVLGMGTCLITEQLSPENPFDSTHLVQVGDIDAMADAALRYLEDDDARERVACAGHAEALRRHTYEVRAAEMVQQWRGLAGKSERVETVVASASAWGMLTESLVRFTGLPWYRYLDL